MSLDRPESDLELEPVTPRFSSPDAPSAIADASSSFSSSSSAPSITFSGTSQIVLDAPNAKQQESEPKQKQHPQQQQQQRHHQSPNYSVDNPSMNNLPDDSQLSTRHQSTSSLDAISHELINQHASPEQLYSIGESHNNGQEEESTVPLRASIISSSVTYSPFETAAGLGTSSASTSASKQLRTLAEEGGGDGTAEGRGGKGQGGGRGESRAVASNVDDELGELNEEKTMSTLSTGMSAFSGLSPSFSGAAGPSSPSADSRASVVSRSRVSSVVAYGKPDPSDKKYRTIQLRGGCFVPTHEEVTALQSQSSWVRWFSAPFRSSSSPSPSSSFSASSSTPPSSASFYCSNTVCSHRYEWFDFLPLNLWEQLFPLYKPANFYFLCIAILQSFSEVSTTQGRPTILLPLTFVLAVTGVKDWIEDLGRQRLDEKKNSAIFQVYRRKEQVIGGGSESWNSESGNGSGGGNVNHNGNSINNNEGSSSVVTLEDEKNSSEAAERILGAAGEWFWIRSSDLLVGDIIRLHDGQRVPADVLLLTSSSSSTVTSTATTVANSLGSSSCFAFVDTRELDGESSLKPIVVPSAMPMILSDTNKRHHIESIQMDIFCDTPNATMNEWQGQIVVSSQNQYSLIGTGVGGIEGAGIEESQQQKDNRSRTVSNLPRPTYAQSDSSSVATSGPPSSSSFASTLSTSDPTKTTSSRLLITNLLLSDSYLRTTKWIIGTIIYTGSDTKIQKNLSTQQGRKKEKASRVFRRTKMFFATLVGLQFLCCLTAAIAAGIYESDDYNSAAWYLGASSNASYYAFLRFFTWFIICKDFVPISLYVSLELVQFWQAQFIGWDAQMAFIREEEHGGGVGGFDDGKSPSSVHSPIGNGGNPLSPSVTTTSNGLPLIPPVNSDGSSVAPPAAAPSSNPSMTVKSLFGFDDDEDPRQFSKVQTSKLNEELGQIDVVFSDKTGTLTQNNMTFKRCMIGQRNFGSKHHVEVAASPTMSPLAAVAAATRNISSLDLSSPPLSSSSSSFSTDPIPPLTASTTSSYNMQRKGNKHVNFDQADVLESVIINSSSIIKRWQREEETAESKSSSTSSSSSSASSSRDVILNESNLSRQFLYALALNNTVFPKPLLKKSDKNAMNDPRRSMQAARAQMRSNRRRTYLYQPINVGLSINQQLLLEQERNETNARAASGSLSAAPSGTNSTTTSSTGLSSGSKLNRSKRDAAGGSSGLGDDADDSVTIQMDAASPDEQALTSFAQSMGFELFSRSGSRVKLRASKTPSEQQQSASPSSSSASNLLSPPSFSPAFSSASSYDFESFDELARFEFTPKRKRMTVILRPVDTATGKAANKVVVFMKGADSTVKPFLNFLNSQSHKQAVSSSASATSSDPSLDWSWVSSAVSDYGRDCLRTLVVAHSELPLSWWENDWCKKYESAQVNLTDTEKGHIDGNCSENCNLCYNESSIESSARLQYLGVTAIEDALQVGVPEALHALQSAQIKIMVLTGDLVSTAIHVAKSCGLFDLRMQEEGRLFVLDKERVGNAKAIEKVIQEAKEKIQLEQLQGQKGGGNTPKFGLAFHGEVWKLILKSSPPLAASAATPSSPSIKSRTVVDDSSTSSPASSSDPSLLSSFLSLASLCSSVVACRLEPKDKADIVSSFMVLDPTMISLAIGDGNNDTPMIRTANVGVGIRGVEGTAAIAVSDVVISQFRFLTRLLFVHGRHNYRRVSLLVLYIFYKASIVVWTVFFFGFYSQFSGQYIYLDWLYQFHNVLFTALPILIFAVFDKDVSAERLQDYPQIYALTRERNKTRREGERRMKELATSSRRGSGGGNGEEEYDENLQISSSSSTSSSYSSCLPSFLCSTSSIFAPPSTMSFFSWPVFIEWMTLGFSHACLCFFVPFYVLESVTDNVNSHGLVSGAWATSMTIYTCVVLVTNVKLLLVIQSFTILHWIAWVGSNIMFFAALAICSSSTLFNIGGVDYYYQFYYLIQSARFWLVIIFVILTCFMSELAVIGFRVVFHPTPNYVVMEADRLGLMSSKSRGSGSGNGDLSRGGVGDNENVNIHVNSGNVRRRVSSGAGGVSSGVGVRRKSSNTKADSNGNVNCAGGVEGKMNGIAEDGKKEESLRIELNPVYAS